MNRVYAHSFESSMWLDLSSDPPFHWSPDGDPLWFSHGKGSDDLIPAVYTLWKKYDLLSCITTPASVIPVLVGGADLMIPGVVPIPSSQTVVPPQLVAIAQYFKDSPTAHGPPLGVWRWISTN
ncbi:hypothetical protein EDC04DRAFT_2736905 [Pisolithus marmoratus]|nr:hypothetical protein EDC04DRAFT_2736905 [Pisolithus marmoratus]